MKTATAPIVDFFETIDSIVTEWSAHNRAGLSICGVDIHSSITSYLAYRLFAFRDQFIEKKIDVRTIRDELPKLTPSVAPVQTCDESVELSDTTLCYANGPRMARQLKPIYDKLKADGGRVVFLCDFKIEGIETVSLGDFNKSHSTPGWINEHYFEDYTRLFSVLYRAFREFRPKTVFCVDGCQTGAKILAEIARHYGAEAICLQQGWPSFLHSGFRRMPYSKFLTWGKGFSKLYAAENPDCPFIEVGYPYRIIEQGTHNAILFCLQAPVFLATNSSFAEFLKTVDQTARRYPHRSILVREHPDYKLPEEIREWLAENVNVEFCSGMPIEMCYSRAKVVVAHFSSTLMECLVHGCIPISLDFAMQGRYSPDLETTGLGFICTNRAVFFDRLEEILNQGFSCSELSEWFSQKSAEYFVET